MLLSLKYTPEKKDTMLLMYMYTMPARMCIAFNSEILAGGIKKMKKNEAVKQVVDNADMLHRRWEELY